MSSRKLSTAGLLLLTAGVVLLAVFAPFVVIPLLAWLPALLGIGWAVWVIVLLRDIRYELRALRQAQSGAERDQAPQW